MMTVWIARLSSSGQMIRHGRVLPVRRLRLDRAARERPRIGRSPSPFLVIEIVFQRSDVRKFVSFATLLKEFGPISASFFLWTQQQSAIARDDFNSIWPLSGVDL